MPFHRPTLDSTIWMSHWHRRATKGAEFWISCKWLKLLWKAGHLELIQNSAPSVAQWRQCDIRMIIIWDTTMPETRPSNFGQYIALSLDGVYQVKHLLKNIYPQFLFMTWFWKKKVSKSGVKSFLFTRLFIGYELETPQPVSPYIPLLQKRNVHTHWIAI